MGFLDIFRINQIKNENAALKQQNQQLFLQNQQMHQHMEQLGFPDYNRMQQLLQQLDVECKEK